MKVSDKDIQEAKKLARAFVEDNFSFANSIEDVEELLSDVYAFLPCGDNEEESDDYFNAMQAVVFDVMKNEGADILSKNKLSAHEKKRVKALLEEFVATKVKN